MVSREATYWVLSEIFFSICRAPFYAFPCGFSASILTLPSRVSFDSVSFGALLARVSFDGVSPGACFNSRGLSGEKSRMGI